MRRLAFVCAAALAPLLICVAAPERAAEAAIPVVDSCEEANYVDATAVGASRDLVWDFVIAGDPRRCLKIRAGQSVRWVGEFSGHPLQNDEGVDRPNPIEGHDANGLVSFPAPGVFGYRCQFHLSMRGAIQVVAAAPVPAGGPSARVALGLALALIALIAQRRRVLKRTALGRANPRLCRPAARAAAGRAKLTHRGGRPVRRTPHPINR